MDMRPLFISLQIALLATALSFVLGLLAARLVYRAHGAWRYAADVLFSLPLVLPPTVVGFYLLVLFGKNGPLSAALSALSASIIFTPCAAVIAATVVSFPLLYRAARAAFEQVDTQILAAARTLGFSEWKIFFRLLLPLSRPGILGGLVLAFARALGEFGATMMVAGNIPGKTETMPLAIYFAIAAGDMQTAAVWAAVITLVSAFGLGALNAYGARRAKKGARV